MLTKDEERTVSMAHEAAPVIEELLAIIERLRSMPVAVKAQAARTTFATLQATPSNYQLRQKGADEPLGLEGIPLLVDTTLPPGQIDFVDSEGRVIGRITGIATREDR